MTCSSGDGPAPAPDRLDKWQRCLVMHVQTQLNNSSSDRIRYLLFLETMLFFYPHKLSSSRDSKYSYEACHLPQLTTQYFPSGVTWDTSRNLDFPLEALLTPKFPVRKFEQLFHRHCRRRLFRTGSNHNKAMRDLAGEVVTTLFWPRHADDGCVNNRWMRQENILKLRWIHLLPLSICNRIL